MAFALALTLGIALGIAFVGVGLTVAVVTAEPASADARPIAANDSLTVLANEFFSFDFCANDIPGDGASTIAYVTTPPAGLTQDGCVLSGSTAACDLNEIWYLVLDQDGDGDWGTVALFVDCSNIDRVPIPQPDILRNFFRNQSATFDLCANDDLGDQPTTVWYHTSLPEGLTIEGCSVTGIPVACASAANFFYWLEDADGDRGFTYSTVQVRCTPAPEPDVYAMQEGDFFTANVCVNDYLADEPTTTVYSTNLPAGLALSDCVLSGTPAVCGDFETIYWLRDRDDDRSSAAIEMSITCLTTPKSSVLYFDDIETDTGWTVNAAGTDTATRGQWARANPARTAESNVVYQPGVTPSGIRALVTGAGAGINADANDVDGGATSIRSAPIVVPPVELPILEFDWYFAHASNADTTDLLQVHVIGPGGTTTVLSQGGTPSIEPALWRHFAVAIPQYAGATIEILIVANDGANPSRIEAGIDNLALRQVPIAPAAPPGVAITHSDYKLPAAIHPDVRTDLETELWATVYRPKDLTEGPYPVVLMMHGNHATCGAGSFPRLDDNNDYATTGTCPAGYTPVPNQEGHAWLAEPLAAAGYIVVSVNTNRGINGTAGLSGDDGLILARGNLALLHLEALAAWSSIGGAPDSLGVGANGLVGMIDFGEAAYVGHSRGAEGVRAAYNLYQDPGSSWPARIPGLQVKAMAEISPTDGMSARVFDVANVAWLVVLPACDQDSPEWPGFDVFTRAQNLVETTPAPKAMFSVWGADHNGYNTEWHQTDTQTFGGGCDGEQNWPINDPIALTSAQIASARAGVSALVFAHVGPKANLDYTRTLDPLFSLPPSVTDGARVERTWLNPTSASLLLDDFSNATGLNVSGQANDRAGLTVAHKTAPAYLLGPGGPPAAELKFNNLGAGTYFQTNWTAPGSGQDVSGHDVLEFRIGRADVANRPANPDFAIQLVHADGTFSDPVTLDRYATVWEMPGVDLSGKDFDHPGMQSIRIPLSDFATFDLTSVRGVRLTFDESKGAVLLADMRFADGLTFTSSTNSAGGG